jgi:general secretion pathway protein G
LLRPYPSRRHKMETCENCKQVIGDLEQPYVWKSHVVCAGCHAMLSKRLTVQSDSSEVYLAPQRSLVKSTLIVMTTVVAAMVIISFLSKHPSSLDTSVQKAMETDKTRTLMTLGSLRVLADAVTQYKLNTGRFPTEKEGLKVLIEKPTEVTSYPEGGYLAIKELWKDAWGHEFVYHLYPESGAPFEIMSYGADGQPGGEGANADIRNTDQ